MAFAQWFAHRLDMTATVAHAGTRVAIYAMGGAGSWLVALPLVRWLTSGRGADTRFAAGILFLGVGTIVFTAFVFSMQYRLFYGRWHAPFGTLTWCYQFVFTGAGAVYQFAALGMRPLLPLGGPLLIITALWLARRSR